MADRIRVLVVHEEERQKDALQDLLSPAENPSFEVVWSQTVKSALYHVGAFSPDVILLDPELKDPAETNPVKALLKGCPAPLLLLCRPRGVKAAREALSFGAQDYLVEGKFDFQLLARVLKGAVERRRLHGESCAARLELSRLAARLDMAEKTLAETQSRLREQSQSLEKANEELQKKNLELQRLDQMKSGFLALVTHDLKAPLSVILGYVSILLDESAETPPSGFQRARLEKVKEAGERQQHLVSQLLRVSELELGKVGLRLEEVDLGRMIGGLADSLASLASKKRQTLSAELPADLPRIWADAEGLERVLTNLITNAHKYTPEGGSIRVRALPEGDMARFEVADNGPGIPHTQRMSVFDRFTRLEGSSNTRSMPGLGLGLAICREIVSQHRGRIWIEDAPGGGCLFVFLLPWDARGEKRAGRNILVVEDDADVRALLESLLTSRGHAVTLAEDGLSGIEKVQDRSRKFDIVFTDLMMPGATGVEVVKSVRLCQPQALIAVMSSHTNSDIFFDAMAQGPMTFIAKPFNEAHLQQALSRLLAA